LKFNKYLKNSLASISCSNPNGLIKFCDEFFVVIVDWKTEGKGRIESKLKPEVVSEELGQVKPVGIAGSL